MNRQNVLNALDFQDDLILRDQHQVDIRNQV